MREGRDPFQGSRSGPLSNIFFFNWTFQHQDPGSAFHLHSLLLGGGLYFVEEKTEAQKGHVTLP